MTAFVFLSEPWWEAATALRDEYQGRLPQPAVEMRMNQVVTDIPFDDGQLEMHTIVSASETIFGEGHIDNVDLTVTTDYDTAKSVIVDQDQEAVMSAFMTGKIKVQGDMSKIIAATAVPPTGEAEELARRMREITA